MRFGLANPTNNLDQQEVNSLVFPHRKTKRGVLTRVETIKGGATRQRVWGFARGPGRRPFTAATRIRIPYALPAVTQSLSLKTRRGKNG